MAFLAKQPESPEYVSMYAMDFDSFYKEEASSSPQKPKEKEESNDNCEPNYKRVKLENDPWADYSPPCSSDDGTGTISDGGECSSAVELNDEDKEHHELMNKHFHYQLQLRELFKEKPLIQIQPEIHMVEDLENVRPYVPHIIAKIPELKKNVPPDFGASVGIMSQILLERGLFDVHESFEAAKCLYENIPYVTWHDCNDKIKKKIDFNVKPFSYFSDYYGFCNVVQIFKGLLSCREMLFHPLIRKSYYKDFCKLVDVERKLAYRDFLKSRRPSNYRLYPQHERYYQEISRAKGLRDEHYESCCKQIELQEEFDWHLLHGQTTKLLQSSGSIEKLIHDVDVVPEIFKQLDTELVQLSLKASLEAHQWYEKHTQWYTTNLKLLKEKHSKRETGELDDKLIKFCKSYPCIFDFSLNEPFDSATEERFKDIIDEMKKNWFVGIADHYVIEATLLYMKSIYYEGKSEPSWPIAYRGAQLSPGAFGTGFAYEHPIYEHVFSVDYKLVN